MKLNKRIIIIISMIIAIIIFCIIVFISQKNNIQKFIENLNKEEETVKDGINCTAYDNQNEKLKSLIIISRVNGIQEVEYINDEGKTIKLNCNNKQKIAIDLEMKADKEYNFRVISNKEEKIEKIQTNINDYIKIIKPEDSNELEYNQMKIEFSDLVQSTSKKQYKINNGNWKDYTNTLQIDLEYMQIEKVLKNQIDAKMTIHARTVDTAGNILKTSVDIDTTEIMSQDKDYKIFNSMNKLGYTDLSKYGINKIRWENIGTDNQKWDWYSVGNIGGGHASGFKNYSMEISLNCYNVKLQYETIELLFEYWIDRVGKVQGQIIVNYVDGTSTNKLTEQYTSNGHKQYRVQQNIDTNKAVKDIRIKIWGVDYDWYSSWGRIREINLKKIHR